MGTYLTNLLRIDTISSTSQILQAISIKFWLLNAHNITELFISDHGKREHQLQL